jgi:hypothetical protein
MRVPGYSSLPAIFACLIVKCRGKVFLGLEQRPSRPVPFGQLFNLSWLRPPAKHTELIWKAIFFRAAVNTGRAQRFSVRP